MSDIVKFDSLGLDSGLLEGLEAMGFEQATPIQAQAIPVVMEGKDLIGCAQTGTGKTGAFLIPLLSKLKKEGKSVKALILVPTRELAVQIDQQLMGLGYFTGANSMAIYGGRDAMSWDQEKAALTQGADILIATPGRLISHLNMGYVNMTDLQFLVLDEADRMLDMGFQEDILKIMDSLPKQRQSLLFSATMPGKIREFAKKILNDPAEIRLAVSKPAAGIKQSAYVAYDNQKLDLFHHVIDEVKPESAIVFASRKVKVKEITRMLKKAGYDCAAISSDLSQEEREDVLRAFKSKKLRILVATDVLSRGIDIEDISLVLNYDVPKDPEDYVHRIGRTARAGKKGEAITFINPEDVHLFINIEGLLERVLDKTPLPRQLGDSPRYVPDRNAGKRGRSGSGRPSGNHGSGGNSQGGKKGKRPFFKKRNKGGGGPKGQGGGPKPQGGGGQ